MQETYPCLECSKPMKPQTTLSKCAIHRLCWIRFHLSFWADEFLLSWSRLWHRIDGFVDNNLSVVLGIVGSALFWFAVMSQF